MMDQYKEQYKKETEEIHAPADLIAKTKAAVRQEEARIQRERAAQTAGLGMQAVPAVRRTINRGAAARKWAYSLTAVAAIFILISVSLMMRGLGKSSSDTASYELASEADSGAGEAATEEALEEAIPEAAVETETESEAFDSVASAEETENRTSDRAAATAGVADNTASDLETALTEGAESAANETERAAASKEESVSELGETEDDMWSEQEKKLADTVAESVTIKKVWNKPAFVNRADTELQTFEDMVFQVAQDGDGWIAYVESDTGGGYVIRGEAETMESFLEAGYRRLLEISF